MSVHSIAASAPRGESRPRTDAERLALIERALVLTIGQPSPHEVRTAVRAAYAAVAVLKHRGVIDGQGQPSGVSA